MTDVIPPYFDGTRNPSEVLLTYDVVLTPHGVTSRATYTVPAGRAAIWEMATTMLHRIAAATALGQCAAIWQYIRADATAINLVETRQQDNTVGAITRDNIPVRVYMGAGDKAQLITLDQGTGTSSVEFIGDAKLVEFTP